MAKAGTDPESEEGKIQGSIGAPRPDAETSWLAAVWGDRGADGLYYLPAGVHTVERGGPHVFHLVGFVYKGINGTTFINSHGDRTWAFGLDRRAVTVRRLSLGYRLGLMIGYHGNLANISGVPFRHSFLFKHNVNPIFGFPTQLTLTKHVQAEVFITPYVIVSGVKIALNSER